MLSGRWPPHVLLVTLYVWQLWCATHGLLEMEGMQNQHSSMLVLIAESGLQGLSRLVMATPGMGLASGSADTVCAVRLAPCDGSRARCPSGAHECGPVLCMPWCCDGEGLAAGSTTLAASNVEASLCAVRLWGCKWIRQSVTVGHYMGRLSMATLASSAVEMKRGCFMAVHSHHHIARVSLSHLIPSCR